MTTAPGLHLLVAAKLHANQLERHLELFERSERVRSIDVVRQEPLSPRLRKLTNHNFAAKSLPGAVVGMYRTARQVGRAKPPDWLVGFNPVPWGALGAWAVARPRTKVCLSLIGRDYQQVQKLWGLPFLSAVRHADAVTVPGQSMRTGMIQAGIDPERIHILPHSVDTERFSPGRVPPEFDVISVGQLIERKRMDTLLTAARLLRDRGHTLRLGILGRGPLEGTLRTQAEELGIASHVVFLSYRDDVERILQASRAFALASSWEGVPFALMEAMACGLVPFVTDVGSIADWVRPGINGEIFPVGDAQALARALERNLFLEPGRYEALRADLLRRRLELSLESGVHVWDRILTS